MSKIITNSKSKAVKLSDTQLLILRAAAQRDDRCLAPTAKLRGAVLRKVGERLIERGLVREVPAKQGMSVWRRDDKTARSYALKLTALAAQAIAVDDEDAGETPVASGGPDSSSATSPTKFSARVSNSGEEIGPSESDTSSKDTATPSAVVGSAARTAPSAAPRAGSKLAEVVDLLACGDGAPIDELIAATDWLPHTTRAALTGLRKRGYTIERSRQGGSTRYRLDGATVPESSAEDPVLGLSEPRDDDRRETRQSPRRGGRVKRGAEGTQTLRVS